MAASVGQLEVPVLKAAARLTAAKRRAITVLDVIEPLPPSRRIVSIEGQSVDLEELLLRVTDANNSARRWTRLASQMQT